MARLEALSDTSSPSIDQAAEFPTRSARLIYEAVHTLTAWIRLASELPDDSPHRRSDEVAELLHRDWGSHDRINDNIPASAAILLGQCMGTIAMSERLGHRFAGYMCEVVMRAIDHLDCEGEAGFLRAFLIRCVVHGGRYFHDEEYGRRLETLWNDVDHVLRKRLGDFEDALRQAYTGAD